MSASAFVGRFQIVGDHLVVSSFGGAAGTEVR
jgi:hypothetical protein